MNPQAKVLWKSIRNAKCTDCVLHVDAQSVCLIGDGPVPARFMVVGEAPGFREDEVSRPFSGASGRLLDEVLASYKLNRDDAFVTNVVKCRPPDNRTPKKPEFDACRHYIEEEVEAVKPEFMLLLGNSALKLIKKSGIMKQRGTWNEYQGARTLATVHPAAVLRNPSLKRVFESDIREFSRVVYGKPGTPDPRTFLIHNGEGLRKLCHAILAAPAVAYDIETNGFDEFSPTARLATISIAVRPDLVFVVPIDHPEASWKDPKRVLEIVGNALAYTDAKRIAHNAKFDDRWLRQRGIPINADFDTMLAAHILDENRFKSLKVLAPMILGVQQWAIDMKDGAAMTTPLKKLAKYNGKDSAYTLGLYEEFKAELLLPENVRLKRIFKTLMMPGSIALTDIEQTGLWLDQDRLAKRRVEIQSHIDELHAKLIKEVGHDINWNSTQQLSEVLFKELKLPIIMKTKGGANSTAETVLLRLAAQGHKVPQLIIEWRQWMKYESTYLGNWANKLHDGRMHANYKISGTVTGRLSSGKEEGDKSRGLNAQQIPRDTFIRGVVGAPPGWQFVEADFSQIELRIAAHYAQERTMLRIFHSDGDIHMATAVKVTQKPESKITKEERKKAKGVNFGFVFGMGTNKFVDYARDSYGVTVTPDEAKKFRNAFFDQFPKLRPWHERQRRLAREYKRVQSAIGRVRHLPDIGSGDKEVRAEAERQAINSPVQGLASDMMMLSLTMLHNSMDPKEARIVGTVHDSILFEIKDGFVDKWVPIIKETMENLPLKEKFDVTLTVPIKVDMTIGTHWGEGKAI